MPQGHRLLSTRLVHLLDHLEGQDDVADLRSLAVPNQFHLALVLEQQEAILLGQRLVGLDEADDLLLFLFGQTRHSDPLLLARVRPRQAGRFAHFNLASDAHNTPRPATAILRSARQAGPTLRRLGLFATRQVVERLEIEQPQKAIGREIMRRAALRVGPLDPQQTATHQMDQDVAARPAAETMNLLAR